MPCGARRGRCTHGDGGAAAAATLRYYMCWLCGGGRVCPQRANERLCDDVCNRGELCALPPSRMLAAHIVFAHDNTTRTCAHTAHTQPRAATNGGTQHGGERCTHRPFEQLLQAAHDARLRARRRVIPACYALHQLITIRCRQRRLARSSVSNVVQACCRQLSARGLDSDTRPAETPTGHAAGLALLTRPGTSCRTAVLAH